MHRETEAILEGCDRQPDGSFGYISYGNSRTNPVIEEHIGWLPVQSTLEVLGCQIEVKSEDALSLFRPDLDSAIEYCEQTLRANGTLYWLSS